MSRYYDGDGDDEDFNNQGALWRANADRALNGKRGRKVLAELREALLNLPEKRLIESALCTVNPERRLAELTSDHPDSMNWTARTLAEQVEEQGTGVCAIGAYLWWRKVKAGADPVQAFDQLPTLMAEDHDLTDTAELAQREAGMVFSLAWDLAYKNDETFGGVTPEVRYQRFIDWLTTRLDV